jgi:hypothetical protein
MIAQLLPTGVRWILYTAVCATTAACSVAPRTPAPATIATTSTAMVRPNTLEQDNERRGAPPHADSLGGPYGNGITTMIAPHRRTPSPSARIDGSTTDSALVSYLNSLVYESGRDRSELALVHCKPHHPACAPNAGVAMYIQAEWGMSAVSAASITAQGVIVARIINFDPSRPGGAMGVPPMTRAWWYVYRDPIGLKSIYFTRTHSTTGSAITVLAAPKDFYECPGHFWAVIPPARAKWASCSTVFAARPAEGTPSWSMVPRDQLFVPASLNRVGGPRTRMLIAADTWVSCMATCCSA